MARLLDRLQNSGNTADNKQDVSARLPAPALESNGKRVTLAGTAVAKGAGEP